VDSDIFVPRSLADLKLDFPPQLEHISASSLKMAARCEEQWRQRYLLGKKVPPSIDLLGGRADHGAIERSMVQKVETFTDLPVKEVRDAFVEIIEEEVESAGGLGEIVIKDALTRPSKIKVYDAVRVTGQDLVELYHTVVSPDLQPLHVEKKFSIDVPGVPVELIGYQDLIVADLEGAPEAIIDRKRAGRSKTSPEGEWLLQADIYQLADPLPHEWHISVTTKAPKLQLPQDTPSLRYQVQPRERVERMVSMLVRKIGWMYAQFGPNEPWPTTGKTHPWACGYCGYRDDCWGWK